MIQAGLLLVKATLIVSDADDEAELRATTNACSRGNVLLYPVDTRGLRSLPGPNGQGGALFRGR